MGDTGSMLLGLLLAYAPISSISSLDPQTLIAGSHGTVNRFPEILPLLLPTAILVIPYADMLMAVFRRTRAGKSPFAADRKHLHHRLLDIGHSHRSSVLIMYLWAALFSSAGGVAVDPGQAVLGLRRDHRGRGAAAAADVHAAAALVGPPPAAGRGRGRTGGAGRIGGPRLTRDRTGAAVRPGRRPDPGPARLRAATACPRQRHARQQRLPGGNGGTPDASVPGGNGHRGGPRSRCRCPPRSPSRRATALAWRSPTGPARPPATCQPTSAPTERRRRPDAELTGPPRALGRRLHPACRGRRPPG